MKHQPYRKSKPGFTIIELLIVMSIIIILVLILTPMFLRAIWRGQLTTCISNEKNLSTALNVYATQEADHVYPNSLDVLTPDFIERIPNCPNDLTKSGYTYEFNNATRAFTIHCRGDHSPLHINASYPTYSANGLSLSP